MNNNELNNQPENLETQNTDDDSTITDDLEKIIEQLPENFPQALPIIQRDIAPIIAECDPGLKDHYISLIKKRTKAASKRGVQLEIENAVIQLTEDDLITAEEPENPVIDPEIKEMAEQIASDTQLFKNRIEMVNKLGVIGERRNIGTYMVVIDSSLLPMGTSGSEALAAKNSGPQGSGKSHPLFTTLKLYPKNAYYLITSGSNKSLYNLNDGLKHKALILTEALQLQSGRQGDNELAYSIRTLISEGHLKYQYTGFVDKKKVTIVQELKGPTSLLTTTIHGQLEMQLEDRMITIHPNTTEEQTRDIISKTAEMASGYGDTVDQKTLDSWKLFYQSLESVPVVIQFAKDIAEFINRNGSLPISARRAFKRVLTTIKTIALVHQRQRSRDDMRNVIAEYSDYFIAHQLIGDSFRESLGEGQRYTDKRIRLIEKEGQMTPRALSEKTEVSTAAISQWLKPLIEKGVLDWCDEKGHGFMDVADLEKAKRSGRAYLKVAGGKRLPSVFELTGDARWDKGGDLYLAYDLHLDGEPGDHKIYPDEETVVDQDIIFDDEHVPEKGKASVKVLSEKTHYEETFTDQDIIFDDDSVTSEIETGVKVLSGKSHFEVLKMVDDFRKSEQAKHSIDAANINLSEEFSEILSLDRSGLVN